VLKDCWQGISNKTVTFLDIGAHMGYCSLYMLPLVKAVYAFESDPRARAWLTRNLSPYPNAMVVPVAVGAGSGRATFVLWT
jgi:FkbM family methyltransferase